jgi:hypothetical protein
VDDDRLSGKLSADGDADPPAGDSAPDLTDHAAGAGPETKPGEPAAGHEEDADPRDPESAGNENLRTPGGRSDGR